MVKLIKVIPIKIIKENHDSDWDRVPNRLDCQPLNPKKQHNKTITLDSIRTRHGEAIVERTPTLIKYILFNPQTGRGQIMKRYDLDKTIQLDMHRYRFRKWVEDDLKKRKFIRWRR